MTRAQRQKVLTTAADHAGPLCAKCGLLVDVCVIRNSGLGRQFEAALKRAGMAECAWRNPERFPNVADVAAKFIVERTARGDVFQRPS